MAVVQVIQMWDSIRPLRGWIKSSDALHGQRVKTSLETISRVAVHRFACSDSRPRDTLLPCLRKAKSTSEATSRTASAGNAKVASARRREAQSSSYSHLPRESNTAIVTAGTPGSSTTQEKAKWETWSSRPAIGPSVIMQTTARISISSGMCGRLSSNTLVSSYVLDRTIGERQMYTATIIAFNAGAMIFFAAI